MSDYLAISDDQIEPGRPVTATLMGQLRDNPQASIEGTVGAPKLAEVWIAGGAITAAAASQSMTFVGLSQFVAIKFKIVARPTTDGSTPWLRTSTNGGSSFDAGASDYAFARSSLKILDSVSISTDDASTRMDVSPGVGNATLESVNIDGILWHPFNTSFHKQILWTASFMTGSSEIGSAIGAGRRLATTDVDAIQFLFDTGTIAEGRYVLTGIPA
jgi:hypothetical protein